MAVERISPEEWQRIAPALRTCSQVTIDMAYAVLVDGRKQVDVAKEFDRSKQTVNAAIRRVTAIFNEVIPEDEQLEFVQVWLPPELAKQVKEMAKLYQNKN
ncbi:TrfB-related DNA-binding protein [Escherichia coli]|uniref:TrfB-related DNA-binding protein n=1 Tax=Escherichia coli TaxID=562 RepID=UPI00292BB36E|nr:TrfB-related DNA-binding protein [Escherichia coli]MDV0829721.1 TrfB-related DNA-binding protein [Escherichia coli]MDV0926001.1 TrfB-related DNA-binding protein [Escherichia coli]MDV0972442.1 TrfB-related DNA-binding protein [Escherichia coli]MDV1020992.1 TrfB-related DNA-binding protein [Escherichia coli]MDV1037572.1 TrfB-related DNA-binding protein [Escherichia coli]